MSGDDEELGEGKQARSGDAVIGDDFAVRTPHPLGTTRQDTSLERRPDEHAVLIHIGSAENMFADAGQVFPLDDLGRVRFGRVQPSAGLEVEADGALLHLGLPLPWVSNVHAELSILRSGSDGFRFHLTDLGSRNGTILSGRPIDRSRVLAGEVFEVGRSFWMVRVLSSRQAAAYGRPTAQVGETASPRLKLLHDDVRRLAASELPLLVSGETGSGKEYLARAIHEVSGRHGPFVTLNVAALPAAQLEPHPDPTHDAPHVLMRARGGTVFIDEVGELDATGQAHLLRLAQRAGPPANGEPGPRVDVRIIAATTREIRSMTDDGSFRRDLYACLGAYEGRIPPVRERLEDLGLLVRELCRSAPPLRVTTRAFRRLLGHHWPFNVRELGNVLRAAAAVSDPDDTVTGRGLSKVIAEAREITDDADAIQTIREQIVQLLMEHAGNTDAVADALHRSPEDITAWVRRLGVRPDDYAALSLREPGA